ncbi:hypothetical protein RHCRD62_40081 [Rhodococcus sp. RD6.2]|jgi:hypothetical protein|uniref:hypothetical protein n=1 Tax=Rhodococcus sp. RD6.2 TaxID=260936 RepID=UPI00063B6755|nr:hypothetical protein [Rhodococcus sp. RD6.2]CRK52194.1 hypothetical protein RHCRD62_40081 [Rhodococcus sp. RD6.2]
MTAPRSSSNIDRRSDRPQRRTERPTEEKRETFTDTTHRMLFSHYVPDGRSSQS